MIRSKIRTLVLAPVILVAITATLIAIQRRSAPASENDPHLQTSRPVESTPTSEIDSGASVKKRYAPLSPSSPEPLDSVTVFAIESGGEAFRAINGAAVTLRDTTGVPRDARSVTTDVAGQASFSGLIDGDTYELTVATQGFASTNKVFNKAPGHQDIPVTLEKAPVGSP
jgi:hypothetical protein